MKYVFASASILELRDIETLKTLLEDDGIPCLIKNENLSMLAGEGAMQDYLPEIWILNDGDYPRAHKLIEAWRNAPIETHDRWLCPGCSETIDGQFTSCWKCGRERRT
jgi:hypothetical protein